jgi:hypothetical protein
MKKYILIAFLFPVCFYAQSDSDMFNVLKELQSTNAKTYNDLKSEMDSINIQYEKGQITNDVKTKMIRELEKHNTKNIAYQKELVTFTDSNNRIIIGKDKLIEKTIEITNFVKIVKLDIGLIQDQFIEDKKGVFGMKKAFESGEHIISNKNYEFAKNTYRELCLKIIKSAKKNINIKQIADISIYGYSDGQGITKGSELYKYLTANSNYKYLSSQDLNLYLSELRAKAIVKIIEDLFNEYQTDDLRKNLQIVLKFTGKGEEYPDSSKKYEIVDENRRIVVVKWIVLPEKFLK